MKKLLILVVLGSIIASFLLTSCSSTSAKITVATDATWAPFEYVDEQTKDIIHFIEDRLEIRQDEQ